MNEDLIETLQNYGFSEKEAKIYLTALSLGSAPASTLARNAHETRTTVYSVLGDLVKKGFCSSVVRENVTYFSAVSPETLVKIQEQKYKNLQEKLPEFMAIGSAFGGHSKIKTFEGNNALKNLFLELATTEVDVKGFHGTFTMTENLDIYPAEEIDYCREQKIKKGLVTYRILSNNGTRNQEEENKKDKEYNHKRKTLLVDNSFVDSKSTIHIFGPNKISISFLENNYPYVIIIENKHLFNYLNNIFDYIWEHESSKQKK